MDNLTKKKPSDFAKVFPRYCIVDVYDSSVTAFNIMLVLASNGGRWRELSWDEYMVHTNDPRWKDEINGKVEMSRSRRSFYQVLPYCVKPRFAKMFCELWEGVYYETID